MRMSIRARRFGLAALVATSVGLAACTPAENEGGTPIPSAATEAPLNDEAVGPSEEQAPVEDDGG